MIDLMETINRFLKNIILSYKSIYGWMSWQTYLFIVILMPFSQTALFSYLNYFIKGETGMKYAALGNSLYSICIFTVFTIGSTFSYERRLGTLQLVLLSPINKTVLFTTKSILHIAEGVITCGFSLLLGNLFFGLDFSGVNWIHLVIVVLMSALMMMGVGFFAGVTGLLLRRATPILNFITLSLFLLCGVNFPSEQLPPFLALLARFIPLTHGIKLLRNVYNGAGILDDNFLYLCLTGILFFVVSNYIFIISEKHCRRKGTLDFY